MDRRDDEAREVISQKSFSSRAVWSLAGEIAPFLFAIPAIPLLVHLVGSERFGVLSIVWVAIGYFNLFDFGLGRAVTQFAAERIGAGRSEDVPEVVWSGMSIVLPLGFVVAAAIAFWAPAFPGYIEALGIADAEVVASLRLAAVAIPFVMAATMLKGLLQAAHEFRIISRIQLLLGTTVFFGPVLVAWLGYPELQYLTFMLLVGRIAVCVWYVFAALRLFPGLAAPSFSKLCLVSMLRYSVWIAISNFIGPLMGYCDRVIIAAYLGAVAVAYYVTPFDVITRTSIFSVSIAAVVFPAVAYVGQTAHRQVAAMMEKVELLVGAFTLPAYFILAAFAADLLRLWISDEFAAAGALPAAFLCAGMFANSILRIPHAVIQGRGRADLTAIANLVELPIYFLALFVLLPKFGLAGVAACWAGRTLLDYIILRLVAGRLLHATTSRSIAEAAGIVAIVLIIACVGTYPLVLKVIGTVLALSTSGIIAYRHGLSPSKLLALIRR